MPAAVVVHITAVILYFEVVCGVHNVVPAMTQSTGLPPWQMKQWHYCSVETQLSVAQERLQTVSDPTDIVSIKLYTTATAAAWWL